MFLISAFGLMLIACDEPAAIPGGSLSPTVQQPLETTFTVGEFIISVDGPDAQSQSITITHSADAGRILWRTIPGRAFLSAARGRESVHEARGSFFVEDERLEICDDQTLDSIRNASGGLRIQGRLSCPGNPVHDTEGGIGYAIEFSQTPEGHLRFQAELRSSPESDAANGYNRIYLIYGSREDQSFYGFGEQFTYFDMKGRRLPIFIMEQGIGRGAEPITTGANLTADSGGDWHTSYAGVPHYITSDLTSLFLENYEYSVFDLRAEDRVVVELFSDEITGRILYADSPLGLISEYTEYCGRMRRLPDWMYRGAIIGMQGGTEKVRDVHKQLKEQNAPIAGFWLQDWEGQRLTSFGKQLWWNWELDHDRYPEWDRMTRELKSEGIETLVYINPFLADVSEKENHRRNLFAEARDNGYLIKNRAGEPYLILNTSFSAGLIDLSNPAARTWIKSVIKDELIASGARGWMADFGEALPYDAVLYDGSPVQWHNRYAEEWAQVNREAINEAGLGNEIVFFSRSGYTKSPGITTLFWLGDQMVDWDEYDGIKSSVTGLLTGGISGYSLNHSDIGGYTTINNPIKDYHRSKELLERWIELNAFTAVFRTHEGNRPDENHQIYSDAETLAFFSRFARVYTALADYRRNLVERAALRGEPVVRHLFLHYPDDPEVRAIRYEQFMLGPDFLIAPVLDEGADEVRVYLPAGEWIHLWSGDRHGDASAGKYITVAAPIGQPAVFYKADSNAGQKFRERLASEGLLP